MKVKIKKVPQQRTNNGLTVENNAVTPLSPQTFNLGGKPHSEGGTDINFNGVTIEAEKNEPVSLNNRGDLVVFGGLTIPGTKTKFKTAAKKIGEQEGKATKQGDKGQELIALNDPYDKYEALSFNSGVVKNDAAAQKLRQANQEKELLGNLQQMILDGSQVLGVKPEEFEKSMKNGGQIAQSGKTIMVNDRNDPRYKAYQDSLSAYNELTNMKKYVLELSKDFPGTTTLVEGNWNDFLEHQSTLKNKEGQRYVGWSNPQLNNGYKGNTAMRAVVPPPSQKVSLRPAPQPLEARSFAEPTANFETSLLQWDNVPMQGVFPVYGQDNKLIGTWDQNGQGTQFYPVNNPLRDTPYTQEELKTLPKDTEIIEGRTQIKNIRRKKAQSGATLFQHPTTNPFSFQLPDWRTAQYAPPPFTPTPLEAVAPNEQGTLAQRNNNPGNLRFNNQKGATKGDRGFAKFNSYEEGYQALLNDLKAKQTGKSRTGLKSSSTLQDLINVYAPKADNNDPTSYANTVAKQLGITPGTPIGDLNTDQLAKAMAQVEDRAYAASRGNTPQQQVQTPTPVYEGDPTPYQRPLIPLEQVGLPPVNTSIRTQYINPETQQFQDQAPSYMQQAPQYTQPRSTEPLPSLADRNKLGIMDFLPEIGAILDRPDYVPLQQYTPNLLQNTSYSFQDRLNANQSSFNTLSRNFANNPEALSVLAGQAYQANQQVLGDEFRTNQASYNQVQNQNNQILNSAELQNIQLRDQQAQRQATASAITDQNRQNALNSISNKYAQNRAQNNDLRLVENMFNYRPDQNMQLQNYNYYDFNQGAIQPQPIGGTPEEIKLQTQRAKAERAQYEADIARQKAAKKNTNIFSNLFGRR